MLLKAHMKHCIIQSDLNLSNWHAVEKGAGKHEQRRIRLPQEMLNRVPQEAS